MKTTLKNILKFILPSGILLLVKKWINRSRRNDDLSLPQFWQGQLLGNVVPQDERAFGVTLGYETRIGEVLKSGDECTVDLEPDYDYDMAVGTKSPMTDLELFTEMGTAFKISGPLPRNRWINFRLHGSSVLGKTKLSITFKGNNELYFARPIRREKPAQKKDVVLLVLDSLAFSQVACLSENQETITPNIDRFFSQGSKFINSYSQGEWTLSSMTSMVTGMYSIHHGNYNPQAGQRPIPLSIKTLPEILKDNGYNTYCFSTGRRFLPSYGHFRGFDKFLYNEWSDGQPGLRVVNDAIQYMETSAGAPTFSLLHFYDPHPPFGNFTAFSDLLSPNKRYSDPGELYTKWKKSRSAEDLKELRQLGDIKVKELDFYLQYLFAYLENSGKIDNTLVVLTSDHARTYEKDIPLLTDNLTHTPFLVAGPGVSKNRSEVMVESSIDVFATILDELKVPLPENCMGHNVLKKNAGDIAISESPYVEHYEVAIRNSEWAFIHRCPLMQLTGEVHLMTNSRSWLFERKNYVDDYSKDFAGERPDLIAGFMEILEKHVNGKKYYDENSAVPYTWKT